MLEQLHEQKAMEREREHSACPTMPSRYSSAGDICQATREWRCRRHHGSSVQLCKAGSALAGASTASAARDNHAVISGPHVLATTSFDTLEF